MATGESQLLAIISRTNYLLRFVIDLGITCMGGYSPNPSKNIPSQLACLQNHISSAAQVEVKFKG